MAFREPDQDLVVLGETEIAEREDRALARAELAERAREGSSTRTALARRADADSARTVALQRAREAAHERERLADALVPRHEDLAITAIVSVVPSGALLVVGALAGLSSNLLVGVAGSAFAVCLAGSSSLGRSLRHWRGQRRLAAATAAQARLPFVLDGFAEVILARPAARGTPVTITLSYAGNTPPGGTVRDLLGVLATSVSTIDGEAVFEVTVAHRDARGVPRWIHRLVHEVLLPLHRAYPLARVSLEARP